jgi:two-component system cell cycle response regulator
MRSASPLDVMAAAKPIVDLAPPLPLSAGRILVVEDNAAQRLGMKRLLEQSGYEVAVAGDGLEALTLIDQGAPDVVIADVHMPRCDGIEMTQRLRRLTADLPVILVSAVSDTSSRVRGLDAGASDFVSKPLDVGELLARVRAQLRQSRRAHDLLHRSRYDALTCVLNRAAIVEELARELKLIERNGAALSLLLIDVDDFKAVNDTQGHPAGDEVLTRLARALEHTVRATDRVGRIGGDEFLVVLPECDASAAASLIQRLRSTWRAEAPGEIGLSIGATTATASTPVEVVVRLADEAMYRDKRRGPQPLVS